MTQLRNVLSPFAALAVLLAVGCAPPVGDDPTPSTSGGRSGTGGGVAPGSGGSGPTGSGGAAAPGSGGRTAASGGSGSGGSSSGSGGSTRSGGANGSGGRPAGSGGATSVGGATSATGGAGVGGASGGDDFVTGVTVTVNSKVVTVLNVAWMQTKVSDQTWLEFTFTGGSVMKSRAKTGTMGAHTDVVLGVPGATMVSVHIVNKVGGTEYKTMDYQKMTGAVPSGMPKYVVSMYDPALASPERFIVGSVENSRGGSDSGTFDGSPWWVYIMDRQGRIVWYYSNGSSSSSSFPRKARDGEYLFFERGRMGQTGMTKMTLDETYLESTNLALSDGLDMMTDGTILYENNGTLIQRSKSGAETTIWSCGSSSYASKFGGNCYSNVVNWDDKSDTVLMSFPDPNTVLQIDRKAKTVLGAYGDSGDYAFSPNTWALRYNHFPNISPEGTLFVSTHLKAYNGQATPAPMHHAFVEFTIDRTTKTLTEKWSYTLGVEWPTGRGEVHRVSNNNVLANYGTQGIVVEITPDKKRVFYIKFDVATGDDYYNKLVGHHFLLDDLYSLNQKPQ